MEQDRYFPTIRQLAQYEVWCNTKMIEAAAALDTPLLFQRFPFGFSQSRQAGMGTVHETLYHLLEVFEWWGWHVRPVIAKPQERTYDPKLTMEDFAQWNRQFAADFLEAIDSSHAAGVLHLDRRIVQVYHLVGHGTHHRTQLITMLRMLGKDPPFEAGDFAGWEKTGRTAI
jgi:uncharacterized damage-inducible protein DinB